MISSRLLNLARCPDCGGCLVPRFRNTATVVRGAAPGSQGATTEHIGNMRGRSNAARRDAPPGIRGRGSESGRLDGDRAQVQCTRCGRVFASSGEYLVLHPGVSFAEQTKYLDEALHADARHEHVSPPLLAAKIRNDMLRSFLSPGPSDTVIDLGCGSGRALVWNADLGAYQVGLDVSPHFAEEARTGVDLVLGDLRRLPFGPACFTKAYALDVAEHLSRDSLAEVLAEAARVLTPGGALFVYSHVRRNSALAGGLKTINRLARWLERRGLVDLSRERLRKSDHLNPLADIPDLERVVSAAVRVPASFYPHGHVLRHPHAITNIGWLPRASRQPPGGAPPPDAARAARTAAKQRLSRKGPAYVALRAVSWMMKLDLLLFGRVRSGPFFALLVKE